MKIRQKTGPVALSPMEELDEMIRQGYGDVPQWQLPKDWRTVRREHQKNWNVHYRIGMPEELLPRRGPAARSEKL